MKNEHDELKAKAGGAIILLLFGLALSVAGLDTMQRESIGSGGFRELPKPPVTGEIVVQTGMRYLPLVL